MSSLTPYHPLFNEKAPSPFLKMKTSLCQVHVPVNVWHSLIYNFAQHFDPCFEKVKGECWSYQRFKLRLRTTFHNNAWRLLPDSSYEKPKRSLGERDSCPMVSEWCIAYKLGGEGKKWGHYGRIWMNIISWYIYMFSSRKSLVRLLDSRETP